MTTCWAIPALTMLRPVKARDQQARSRRVVALCCAVSAAAYVARTAVYDGQPIDEFPVRVSRRTVNIPLYKPMRFMSRSQFCMLM